jgi:hypothetical protein
MNAKNSIGIISLVTIAVLSSCEHNVQFKTKVHADGSLDKTIILEAEDSTVAQHNRFNVSESQGWKVSVQRIKEKDKKFRYTFQKSFSLASHANTELVHSSDSLFSVTSKFESRFRWFYTYLDYSDTYRATNRFDLPVSDYLNKEDFQFIDNLPAEGKSISKADSLFLTKLNERIFDHYATRGYFEDYYRLLTDLTTDGLERKLLASRKEKLFQLMNSKDNGLEGDFLPKLADSLGLAINFSNPAYKIRKAEVENKFKFMSWATEGKYQHTIEIPGEVVSHNADSIQGNSFYWSPSHLKFAFHDYSFFVTTRKPNVWAWLISLGVIGLTILGLIRSSRKKQQMNS